MEIEGKDGSKTLLKEGLQTEFGRGLGFDFNDRTVSRHHVSFQLHPSDHKDEAGVCFEVTGKNPMWIYNSRTGEIRIYRRFERGEMEVGDMFCVSAMKPFWFTLKRIDFEGEDKNGTKSEVGLNELAESLQSSRGLTGIEELGLESTDVSNIEPVKEFGFVVMGHEFDGYSKKMIRDIKYWDWFLEETEESEDEEVGERKGKKGVRRKRKKDQDNDDEDEWTGESEDDKGLITNLRKAQRPKYSTRLKERDKHIKDTKVSKNPRQKKTTSTNEKDIEDEDEDDDTLGGFIVDDEDLGQEVESDEDEDDEEEEEEDFDEEDEEE